MQLPVYYQLSYYILYKKYGISKTREERIIGLLIILYFTKKNDHGYGNNKINTTIMTRLSTLQRIKNMQIILKQNNSILIFYTIFIIYLSLNFIKMYFFLKFDETQLVSIKTAWTQFTINIL